MALFTETITKRVTVKVPSSQFSVGFGFSHVLTGTFHLQHPFVFAAEIGEQQFKAILSVSHVDRKKLTVFSVHGYSVCAGFNVMRQFLLWNQVASIKRTRF